MSSNGLLPENEVIRRLQLQDRPNRYAQRKALDRLWWSAQLVRKDLKMPPLKRIKVGARYLYDPRVFEDFLAALSVA